MEQTFRTAIVKKPAGSFSQGITRANLGRPDLKKALNQHDKYIRALQKCGLEVIALEADPEYPDSTFVEDAAIVMLKCAVITNPGAVERKGETTAIKISLSGFYDELEHIEAPGTLDGGDVMVAGSNFFIGLSERTNLHGAEQLIEIINRQGMNGVTVKIKGLLHLKSGVNYLSHDHLLMIEDFIHFKPFQSYSRILVPSREAYAANSLWINDRVLVPKGFPETSRSIHKAGYEIIELDMSEFQKLDGGLSCLSLRF